jgi:hypothetical protein
MQRFSGKDFCRWWQGFGGFRESMISGNFDGCIYLQHDLYIQMGGAMAAKLTSIRLDTKLADEAARVLGVNSRTEAVHAALREVVGLKRFQDLMKKYGGTCSFGRSDE